MTEINRRTFITRIAASLAALAAAPLAWMGWRRPSKEEQMDALLDWASDLSLTDFVEMNLSEGQKLTGFQRTMLDEGQNVASGNLYARATVASASVEWTPVMQIHTSRDGKNWERLV